MTFEKLSGNITEKRQFSERPELLPSLVLAYLGDAVYELAVREYLIRKGLCTVHKLHRSAVHYVRASAQAGVLHNLEAILQNDELDVIRRGRNAKPGHCPKGVSQEEYGYSTALESLIGYLYLRGDFSRLSELLEKVFSVIDKL
jgi:ribonuclease-3 family protein